MNEQHPTGSVRATPIVKKAFHILRIVAVVAVFNLIGRQIYNDWGSLATQPPQLAFETVAGALATGLAGFAALICIWFLLLRRGGYLNRSFFLFFVRIWLQTYLLRYIPGKVATIAERLRLSAKVGVPAGASIALMGWETLLLVAGAAVVVPLAIIIGGPATAAVGAYVLAAPLAALAMAFAAPPLLRVAMSLAWARRRFGSLASIEMRRRDIFIVSFVAGLFWMLFGTSFFFVASWFTPLSLADYPVVVSWFVISYLAGLAAVVVPAGLGVREAVLLIGLGSVMSGGQAAVVVVAARLWFTLLEMVCVGLASLVPYPDQGNIDGQPERTVPGTQINPSEPLETRDG